MAAANGERYKFYIYRKSRVILTFGKCDVETRYLNRYCRFVIDTQIEIGIIAARPLVRDSP